MSYFKIEFTAMESDPEYTSTEVTDDEEENTLLEIVPPPPPDRTHQARERGRLVKPKERKHILLALVPALVFTTQFACRGYLTGVLSTIQHSLDISQGEAWLIDIMFDFGVIIGVVVLLSCRTCVNRPRCVAGGSFLVGAGLFISSIPYFTLHPSPAALGSSKLHAYLPQYEICALGEVKDETSESNQSTTDAGEHDEPSEYIKALGGKELAIIFGMLLCGFGASPQWVCGLPYLLDRTKKPAIVIIGLYLSASLLGHWGGELLSFIIERNTEPLSTYGAVARWWLGFLLLGLNGFLTALILIMYNDVPDGGKSPSGQQSRSGRLPSESSTIGNNEDSSAIGSPMGSPDQNDSFYYMRLDDVGTVPSRQSQITEACCSVYKQSNLVMLCVGTSFEAAILTGFLIFQPRFYGIVSGIGIFAADFYFSTAVLVGVLVGALIGLVAMQIIKPAIRKMWRMTWIMCVVTMGITWVLFLYSCSEAPVDAYEESPGAKTKADDLSQWVDLNQTCSNLCGCPNRVWHPVCGSDHVTYISPCLAGCQELTGSVSYNFTKCLCIDGPGGSLGSATTDPCPAECQPMWSHMLAIFFIFLLTGVNFPIIIFIVTGTVKLQRRNQSLGMLVIMWHLIGVLPAIGIFNAVLGQACSLWQSTHEFIGQHYSDCLMYHPGKHHFFFVSLVLFLKAIALIFYGVSYRATVKLKKDDVTSDRNWIGFNGAASGVDSNSIDVDTPSSPPAFL